MTALEIAVQYQAKRDERLALDKQVAKLVEEEGKLKISLFQALEAAGVRSVGNAKNVFAIVTKLEPQPDDWSKLYDYVRLTGEFDLLFRRINPAAVKERWENGVVVPGVAAFPVDKLSITKAQGA